jgi:sterol 3beta-glucosyltransferase
MYNGNVSDLVNEEVFDTNVEEDESDGEDNTLEPDSNDDSIHDTLQRSTLNERPGSLFELSIVEKLNSKGSTQDLRSRAKNLSDKLRDTFGIKDDDIFLAEYSCWLLKDVLLQGHIYLTQSHLLFLAFLPKYDKDKNTLTGSLAMETIPPRMSRYWAVLKNHTLSLYNKSTDLYFPVLTIDLRYAVRAEVLRDSSKNNWFRILTEKRSYRFQADSSHNARSWVGMLKKHIFTIRNKGDCVTVKIPLENVIDARETEIIDSAETIRLKVLEGNGSFAYDDYIFTFFTSGPDAFRSITEAIGNLKESEEISSMGILSDSTARLKVIEETRRSVNPLRFFKSKSGPCSPLSPVSPTFSEAIQSPDLPLQEQVVEQYLTREGDVEVIPDDISDDSPDEINTGDVIEELPSDSSEISPLVTKNRATAKSTLSRWTPKIIKSASSMWVSNPVHYSEKNSLEWGSEDEYLASEEERAIMTKRFQSHFSLSESDVLIATYYAYLHRNIPMYGKVYLGEKEICFRSLVPGFHTKMILPYMDIENCYKEKGFKFGYHGLVIVIHGHEELFLEFSSSAARDDCEYLLLKQLEIMSSVSSALGSDNQMTTSQNLEAAKIKFFEDKIHSEAGVEVPIIIEDHPILKTNIKPGKSYKFTLMTIGSRGDVQPYIALGLGLKADGHEVKIATHKEFGDWITGHGLGFSEIAGNPTELMALMVSHGSMNVGLVREASGKFRGWISELLETTWHACQGTEILIESPSTMAGIHIAEALGIPYFRAFTMPWTRTRAYPHAFIVPDEKKGGSYNYLTHVLFENVFWRGISGQVNKWRQETLHLPKTNLDRLKQNNVPFMYNVSPTVLPPPVDFSDWVKVTGYWFLNEASTYRPSKDLLEFIKKAKEDGKKLVYIGFGSIVVSNPKEMTQAIVDSVVEADVRCILNKGWSERLGGSSKIEVELPPEIYNAGSLPHDWLFPQIDAAVHHGGSGTTGATLKAGLPTIIKPFFGDQFFYANRVEDIGAGIGLKELNAKSMSKALKTATTDQRMISKAKVIGERIQKENGVQEAINVLYREVEYARGLILAKRRADGLTERYKEEEIGEIHDQASDESGSDSWYLVE